MRRKANWKSQKLSSLYQMVESLPSGIQFVISEPTDKYMFACQYENTPIQIY